MKPPAIDTSTKGVRKFGAVLGIFFAILAGVGIWKGHKPYFAASASVFFLIGTAFPSMLRPVQRIWMTFAFFMGRVMTTVILTVVYVLFLTPLSLAARACGVDFLRPNLPAGRQGAAKSGTYWVPSEITQDDKTRYTQQF